MTTAKPSDNSEIIDPCVAEFLTRHGLDRDDGMDVLDTIVQTNQEIIAEVNQTIVAGVQPSEIERRQPAAAAPPAKTKTSPVTPRIQPVAPTRRESVDTMRELRSVANAISVSISRSNLLREKLKEATRFLALGFISGTLALILAYITTSVHSVVFFAALFTLVLGLISTYRSTMIMTKLNRIAKI